MKILINDDAALLPTCNIVLGKDNYDTEPVKSFSLKIERVKKIPSDKLDKERKKLNEDSSSDEEKESNEKMKHQTFKERVHIPFYYHGDGYLPHFDINACILGKWDNNLKYFPDPQADTRSVQDLDQSVRGTFASQF